MLRDTAVSLLAKRLGNRTDLDDIIIEEMQNTQAFKLEQNGVFYPWFLFTENVTTTLVIGESRIALPADFLAEIEEEGMFVTNTDGGVSIVTKGGSQDLKVYYGSATGLPKKYALSGDHFILFPTPDAAYVLTMRYAAAEPVLSTNIENNWLKYAADLMIAEVGATLAKTLLQNPTLAASFQTDVSRAWDRLQRQHEMLQHTNRTYTMGDST